MTTTPEAIPAAEGADTEPLAPSATTKQLRGSAMLLAGRLVALVFTMATQVALVRGLSKGSYGAFAYALSLESFIRTIVSIGQGQGQTISRFLSLYDEERAYDKLFGTMVLAFGSIIASSAVLFTALLLGRDQFVGRLVEDPRAVTLVLILMLLAPLEAFDNVFVAMFAVFSRPRLIFIRKHILTPALRLAVVIALVVSGTRVSFVAWGYVVTGFVGIVIYAGAMFSVLRRRGLLQHFHPRRLSMPVRALTGYAIPLLTSELVYLSMTTGSAIILGYERGTRDVAAYRAVYPAARLNQLVIFTFATLFAPLAARFFARKDLAGMRDAYWQTAMWLTVLTFPVFAATGPLARSTTVTLFGSRYASSGTLLAVLSCAYYFNAALGFNQLTLQTFGRLRFVVGVNTAAAVVNLGLSFILIPRHGALGAAVANGATLAVLNVLNQVGVQRLLGSGDFHLRYLRGYAIVIVASLALWAAQAVLDPSFVVAVALGAAASLLVLASNRDLLQIGDTFPEAAKLPLVRRWL